MAFLHFSTIEIETSRTLRSSGGPSVEVLSKVVSVYRVTEKYRAPGQGVVVHWHQQRRRDECQCFRLQYLCLHGYHAVCCPASGCNIPLLFQRGLCCKDFFNAMDILSILFFCCCCCVFSVPHKCKLCII